MPFLSIFGLLNITTAILWPEVQEQPKMSVVPIEQRASTCLRVFISYSHSIYCFPSLREWYVESQQLIARNLIHGANCIDPSLRVQSLGTSVIYATLQPCHNTFTATEFSWTREYIGDASVELWNHIKNHYESNEQVYANYLAIVQSLGMGKSRIVDEMSKRHFVIPMNLREADSTGRLIALTVYLSPDDVSGYPPADHDVRNYLCAEHSDSSVVYHRACAFLTALFNETASVLRGDHDVVAKPEELSPIDLDEDVASLVAQFRAYMNAGTTMTAHGRFRNKFYAKFVDRVQKVVRVLADLSHGGVTYCI